MQEKKINGGVAWKYCADLQQTLVRKNVILSKQGGELIRKKTVFILGAGSAPTGFPLGRQLMLNICGQLSNVRAVTESRFKRYPERYKGNSFSDIMLDCGFDYKKLETFQQELQKSMQPSIDAFLEHLPEYVDVGKAAIAVSLIPFENLETLLSRSPDQRPSWYEYLFNQMGARKEVFPENKLAIVTFNYDRSLEYFLFTALKNSYRLAEKEAADLLSKIPMVHAHGQLGKPTFWASDGRDYSPEVTTDIIRQCVSEIKIIHEQRAVSEELDKARSLMKNADVLCFLGFGYHPANMERLQLENPITASTHILGTVYRHGADETRRVKELFEPFVKSVATRRPQGILHTRVELGNSDEDVLEFLKNHPVF